MKADLELVRAVKLGDRNSFSELVQRHQKTLMRLVWRMTKDQSVAEDVVQDTFIKAYQKINLFEERSSFKSWLFRIGINTANNKLRSRRNEFVSIERVHISSDANSERGLIMKDLQNVVAVELSRLPERQRIALSLRIFEDLSFHEIAVIMDCPYDTAKANYRHAILKIKTAFADIDWLANLSELEDDQLIRLKEILTEADS